MSSCSQSQSQSPEPEIKLDEKKLVETSNDDLAAPLRQQIALARALLEDLDDSLAPNENRTTSNSGSGRAPCAQVIEELTRLGCRILEASARLAIAEEAARPRPHANVNMEPLRPIASAGTPATPIPLRSIAAP